MSQITITVSGPTGSGKSAIVGEIEIMLKAIGVPVRCDNLSEKNRTGADWQTYIEIYKPSVIIKEVIG